MLSLEFRWLEVKGSVNLLMEQQVKWKWDFLPTGNLVSLISHQESPSLWMRLCSPDCNTFWHFECEVVLFWTQISSMTFLKDATTHRGQSPVLFRLLIGHINMWCASEILGESSINLHFRYETECKVITLKIGVPHIKATQHLINGWEEKNIGLWLP